MSKYTSKYTKELLLEAVSKSWSIAGVLRTLGIRFSSGTHTYVRDKIKEYNIDSSHFTGQGWNRNKRHPIRDINSILTDGHRYRIQGKILRKSLLQIGVKYECVKCKNDGQWNGYDLVLEVDHIDGDWSNNKRDNLQFMCPNCHTQKTSKEVITKKRCVTPKIVNIDESNKPECIQQLRLGFYKAKTTRKSAIDVNWRKLPKLSQRKVDRPSKDELHKMVWAEPTTSIAFKLGVSDKAIAKWCELYGINKPPRGYWMQQKWSRISVSN